MPQLVVIQSLVHGEQFAVGFDTDEVGFSFIGKSVTLILDHKTRNLRIKFTESGCSKTINGTTTTLDTTPVVLSDSNKRASWTRGVVFTAEHFPVGEYVGYFFVGPVLNERSAWVKLELTVEAPQWGPP